MQNLKIVVSLTFSSDSVNAPNPSKNVGRENHQLYKTGFLELSCSKITRYTLPIKRKGLIPLAPDMI